MIRGIGRRLLAAVVLLVIAFGATIAPSYATTDTNPWLERRVMHMAHQGGESEAPSNTLYAFKRAVALGADMIELDVHGTSDGKLVVSHDPAVDRMTNGTGRIKDKTLAQVQALDAAYDFNSGGAYPFRGVRTGDVAPPAGYSADDFKVPSLAEVFAAFPNVPINIEIKSTSDSDLLTFLCNAELLANEIKRSGRTDLIVVSFEQLAVARFHYLAPTIATSPGIAGILQFWLLNQDPGNGTKAIQVPPVYQGIKLATPEFVKRAHAKGFAVHIWADAEVETEQFYNEAIDMCADGVMAAYPSRLEAVLDSRGIVRPGKPGVDPCA